MKIDNNKIIKIVIVTRITHFHSLGGLERHCHDLSYGLTAKGHKVRVISSSLPNGSSFKREGDIEFTFIKDAPPKIYSPELFRGIKNELIKLVQSNECDIILSEGMAALDYVLLNNSSRVPVIGIQHGTVWTDVWSSLAHIGVLRRLWWIFQMRFREPAKRADQFKTFSHNAEKTIAVSDFVARMISVHYKLPRPKVITIPNAVNLKLYLDASAIRDELRCSRGISHEEIVFLCIGRLSIDKGFETAIRAFALVSSRYPHAKMIIAGDGPEREPLLTLSRSLNMDEKIKFLGAVSPSDTPALYASADVMVFPSIRYEGFPYTIIEAWASKCALVVSRREGHQSNVIDGVNGLKFQPKNAKDCARKMEKLLQDNNLMEAIRLNAQRTAVESHSLPDMIDKYEAECFKLLKR